VSWRTGEERDTVCTSTDGLFNRFLNYTVRVQYVRVHARITHEVEPQIAAHCEIFDAQLAPRPSSDAAYDVTNEGCGEGAGQDGPDEASRPPTGE
jgi:hypothetical protein